MHHREQSSDSVLKIRTNPLNIRSSDGSDWVFENEPKQQSVAARRPRIDVSPHRSAIAAELVRPPKQQQAQQVVASPPSLSIEESPEGSPDLPKSPHESVSAPVPMPAMKTTEPLKLAKKASVPLSSADAASWRKSVDASRSSMYAGDDISFVDVSFADSLRQEKPGNLQAEQTAGSCSISDLNISALPQLSFNTGVGTSLAEEFDSFTFSRKPTITSRTPSVRAGKSRGPAVLERLRSIRKEMKQDDAIHAIPERAERPEKADKMEWDEGVSDTLLKAMAMSPNAQWPSEFEEESEPEPVRPSQPVEKNDVIEPQEPTVEENTQEPEAFEMPEHSPGTEEPPSTVDLEYEPEVEQVRSPTLAELDPVSSEDRGRLFMQINKLANIRGLPMDMSRNPRFTITLDNGVQSVTTPPVALPSTSFTGVINAKVGQEFELLVAQDLELVITVNLQMDALPPPSKPNHVKQKEKEQEQQAAEAAAAKAAKPTEAVSTPPPSPKKSLRFWSSPKKSPKKVKEPKAPKAPKEKESKLSKLDKFKEQEKRQTEEENYVMAMETYKRKRDMWKYVTGPEGEFARGYVFESHYEREIFGEPRSYFLPMYNEWASNDPRQVCDLQLTLMYIPKFYASEDLPSSLSSSVQEIKNAIQDRKFNIEGYLSQNGGDLSFWRRRYFKLDGNELVGHHEATKRVRTKIHMQNAVEIVDAAAMPSEDLWFLYKDRSFRITFRDGEQLGFYADTPALKDAWLSALRLSMAFTGQKRRWTDLVLEHRENLAKEAAAEV